MSDKKNQAPLYQVIFESGKIFIGGPTYFNTRWLEIPANEKIKRVFYRMPDGNLLCLNGYEKYYLMMEATNDITGSLRGNLIIENAYLMGLRKRKVTSYRIAIFRRGENRYSIGDITRREYDVNSEKIKKLNPKGWK